jgi:hypothetical protein
MKIIGVSDQFTYCQILIKQICTSPNLNIKLIFKHSNDKIQTMTKFVALKTPIGEVVYINSELVTMLKDKDEVTHIYFASDSNGPGFIAVLLPAEEVAQLLSNT